eukprot:7873-Heterococcus_DN1.PRE.2
MSANAAALRSRHTSGALAPGSGCCEARCGSAAGRLRFQDCFPLGALKLSCSIGGLLWKLMPHAAAGACTAAKER